MAQENSRSKLLIIVIATLSLLITGLSPTEILQLIRNRRRANQSEQTNQPSQQMDAQSGNRYANVIPSIPFLVNGKDMGLRATAGLAMYRPDTLPDFGKDKEAEVTAQDGVITVSFHPRTQYQSDQGSGFNGAYYLYVGLLGPEMHMSMGTSKYQGNFDISKVSSLHFKGEFMLPRQSNDPSTEARSIVIGGQLGFYGPNRSPEKVVAFNNAGYGIPDHMGNISLTQTNAYWCADDSDWWHNIYWGDWWRDNLWDQWISFDIDVKAAAGRAINLSRSGCVGSSHESALPTNEILLWGAFLGPEYGTGGKALVFKVRNLRVDFQK